MLRKFILLSLIGLTIFSFSFVVGSKNYHKAMANILFQEQSDTIDAIEKTKKAVVSVIKTQELTSVITDKKTGKVQINSNVRQISGGSGIVVDNKGLILTNKHVVADSDNYSVILNNGEIYEAKVVARDPLEDVALIKIKSFPDKNDIAVASLADSRYLKIGQTVMAIGYSLGRYKNSVTKGIISGLNRDLVASGNDGQMVNLSNIIQTDAAINSGNSGGALVDLNGKVIGINTAVETMGENVGFAIPSNVARKAIISYRKYGKIKRPKLGLRYTMINPAIAKFAGLPKKQGAWIHSGTDDPAMVSDSPAAKAGLAENDIIFEINAIKLTEDLPLIEVINYYEPGQTIGLKIQRGKKVIIRKITLGTFE